MTDIRHFLDLDVLDAATLRRILDTALALKSAAPTPARLPGCTLAMVFEKPSTRTRVSFEVAIQQLGGSAIVLDQGGTQLGRGETVADTARVLSQYVDAIMLRTSAPENLHEMAAAASVPVINGLTNDSHPCQIMADVMTFEEVKGPIAGKVVAWSGDGNNVAASWIHAAVKFQFELRLATPSSLQPAAGLLEWASANGGQVSLSDDPQAAVDGADCVVTDTWVSMGDKDAEARCATLVPYRIDTALMARAKDDAIFMHCLPAHRGDEVDAAVIDGPQSVVWVEAGNRLPAQKSILLWCLGQDGDDA
ncbi:MAG: ornithine carbamoyltransferase [Alphaproteobacteria bacterium]|nr:ornithine carbamoyltransferase [Alphaproteobacteria bacterium]